MTGSVESPANRRTRRTVGWEIGGDRELRKRMRAVVLKRRGEEDLVRPEKTRGFFQGLAKGSRRGKKRS